MTGGGWTNDATDSLIIPTDATTDDPRIVIATDDPLAIAAGQDAAISYYWSDVEGFVTGLEYIPDGGPVSPEAAFTIAAYRTSDSGFPPDRLATILRGEVFPDEEGVRPTTITMGGETTSSVAIRAATNGLITIRGGGDSLIQIGSDDTESVHIPGSVAVGGDLTVSGTINVGGRVLTDIQVGRATLAGQVSPTSSTPVDVPGATVTITTTRPDAKLCVDWWVDGQLTTAGSVTLLVSAVVDGTTLTPGAIWNPTSSVAVGARDSSSQGDVVDVPTPGTYVVKLQAARATGAGVARVNGIHSGVRVQVFE